MADTSPLTVVKSEPLPALTVVKSDLAAPTLAERTTSALAHPATSVVPSLAAKDDPPVTLGDVLKDPKEALARAGRILGKDLTTPVNVAALLAIPIAPKMIGAATDAVETAGSIAGQVAKKTVARVTGLDPEAMEKQIATTDLATTKLRLAASKSRTRQATMQPAPETPVAPSAPAVAQPAPAAAPAPPVAAPATPVASAPVSASVVEPTPASPAPVDVPRGTSVAPQSPASIASGIWTAARSVKATLTPDENVAAFQAVKGGASPLDAVRAVMQQRFAAAIPGTMTPAQVSAEIAARVGGRSPMR